MGTSKTKRVVAIIAVLVALALIGAGVVWVVQLRYRGVAYRAFPQAETTAELNNPYQGFYTIFGFRLSDEEDPLANLDALVASEGEQRLALVEINLNAFSDRAISSVGLQQLETILSKWSSSDKHLILRFLYDWDGQNLTTEPKNIEQIIGHIRQVAPIVNQYSDTIYILQGVFVGDYGEMHDSKYANEGDMRRLLNMLNGLINPPIYLSVRTPGQWRMLTGYWQAPSYFLSYGDKALFSRLGLFNDGMLGSETDLGTYTDWPRAAEITFQNQLCDYVPNGGEVVIDNPYNDFEAAVADLRDMHVSYLNSAYDAEVLNKWRNTIYYGNDCFQGIDGFTYIKEHLGYRYVLHSSNLEFSTWFDDTALFSCVLENVGFGACLRDLDVSFLAEYADDSTFTEIPVETDMREFGGDEYLRLTAELPVRDIAPGAYRMYLKITDSITGEQIKLATDLAQTEHGYCLGELNLSSFR